MTNNRERHYCEECGCEEEDGYMAIEVETLSFWHAVGAVIVGLLLYDLIVLSFYYLVVYLTGA